MSKEIARVNLNLTKELVEKVDQYADEMNINRTSAISVLLSQALNTQKAMNDLSELLKLVQEQANTPQG